MKNAFDKIMTGLADARTYLKGARDGFEVHAVELPEPDVAATRRKIETSMEPSIGSRDEGETRKARQ